MPFSDYNASKSEASSSRSKRPRETSPESSSTTAAFPALRINSSIFETQPKVEHGEDTYSRRSDSSRDSTCFTKSSSETRHQQPLSGDRESRTYRRDDFGEDGNSFRPSLDEQREQVSGVDPEKKPKFSKVKEEMKPNLFWKGTADGEITIEQQNITNFFAFAKPSSSLPSVAPQRHIGEVGAPLPKIPRTAHYNQHNPRDELNYVKDEKPKNQVIPAMESDSDSDDNAATIPFKSRYQHLREQIFSKYDFTQRTVNPNQLAAYQQKDKIMQAIEGNRVVIIDGFTGCGKTTQVPQLIIDRAYELKRPCNVIVTQPRKLAAISVARRVCEERCWEIGTVVGYQVGMDKKVGTDTLVTYMTTGVLLQKLTRTRSLKNWTHIIVDEVHERDLHTDLLLLVIRKILMDDPGGKERNVKLILMSATLNAKFSEYFPVQKAGDEVGETPVIKIPSFRRYKVEEKFLDHLVSNDQLEEIYRQCDLQRATILDEMYTQAVRTIVDLDDTECYNGNDPRARDFQSNRIKDRGSVLVFLPGIMEIKLLLKKLQEANREKAEMTHSNDPDYYRWDVVPLHSSVTNEEQRKVFDPPKAFRRKVILSTNIAESSITVTDIVYVIDFCLTKSNCVDPRTNFNCLRVCWASVNQCIQRKGRTGRVRDGQVYRMVPKTFFNELDQETKPDMLKSALEYVVLQVKILDMGSPKTILSLALDPPELSGIERAVANLKEVGAMTVLTTNPVTRKREYDTADGDITFMGEIMSILPISPQCTRLILLGNCFGVMKEAIIIAAGLSGKSPFSTPFNKQLESYLMKLNWAKKSYSDCMAILYAYKTWYRQFAEMDDYLGRDRDRFRNEKNWARQQNIQISQMREIRNMVEDIQHRLKEKRLSPYKLRIDYDPDSLETPKEVILMLKIAIAGAFYPNYFHRHRPADPNEHERERSKEVMGHDLFRTVYYKGFPLENNGELYKGCVADSLSHGLSVPYVVFSAKGQKVFALFDMTGKTFGPIPEGVYRAIKKRQIREQLEIKLLSKDEENKELQTYKREMEAQNFLRCPDQFQPPGIEIDKVCVCVSYAESPSLFWVMCANHKDKQNELAEMINTNLLNRPINPSRIYVGGLVLAPFRDENGDSAYYRGRVQAVSYVGRSLVYYIDYGNSDWVENERLQELSRCLLDRGYHQLPGMAIECRLSELKPAVVHGSVWTEAAVKKFKEFVAGMVELELQIYAVDKSVILGRLLEKPKPGFQESRVSLNSWLTRKGFADEAPEPYLPKMNHKARERYLMIKDDIAQIRAYNQGQIAEPRDREYMPVPKSGRMPCTMKGPWSPLELEFQSLCHSSSSKQVTVDNHSVNSVVLDQEPTAPTSRLLVASSINIQERSGKVVARETTIMPAIPGMIALMSLVFTPRAELRCDAQVSRYTGVLCGLGTDPVDEEPIYLDHDMEVVFDTDVDDEDIDLINKIRYSMNIILTENQGQNNASVHNDLCESLITLLKRPRKVAEEIWPQESYVWNRIPPESIIYAPRDRYEVQVKDIFAPHDKIKFKTKNLPLSSWDFAV